MSDIPKIEEYKIANMDLSIEDYKQKPKEGESHFFPNLKNERYFCWVNGCGLGGTNTIKEARQILFQCATASLNDDIHNLNEMLFLKLQAKHLLNDKMDNLESFKV